MSKYEELKDQVERELAWAKKSVDKYENPFDRGMMLAYENIMSKIRQLDEEP